MLIKVLRVSSILSKLFFKGIHCSVVFLNDSQTFFTFLFKFIFHLFVFFVNLVINFFTKEGIITKFFLFLLKLDISINNLSSSLLSLSKFSFKSSHLSIFFILKSVINPVKLIFELFHKFLSHIFISILIKISQSSLNLLCFSFIFRIQVFINVISLLLDNQHHLV